MREDPRAGPHGSLSFSFQGIMSKGEFIDISHLVAAFVQTTTTVSVVKLTAALWEELEPATI